MALVDFTNPDAVRLVRRASSRACSDMGVDAFKTDFGERIPTDVVWHDGSDPERMHNYYTHLYNQARLRPARASAAARARRCCSRGRRPPAASSSRCTGAATASRRSSRWPSRCAAGCRWRCPGSGSGATTSAASRARPTRRCSSAGSRSGCSPRTAGCTARTRTGCRGCSTRRPSTSRATFTRLKLSLMPYLAAAGRRGAHATGSPVMRPMVLEFPDDRPRADLDPQYMLGDALLVAPVFAPTGDVDVLRARPGAWTHLLTGTQVTGPRLGPRARTRLDSLPLLVRPGTGAAASVRRDGPSRLRLRRRRHASTLYELERRAPLAHGRPRARRDAGRDVHRDPHGRSAYVVEAQWRPAGPLVASAASADAATTGRTRGAGTTPAAARRADRSLLELARAARRTASTDRPAKDHATVT